MPSLFTTPAQPVALAGISLAALTPAAQSINCGNCALPLVTFDQHYATDAAANAAAGHGSPSLVQAQCPRCRAWNQIPVGA